MLSRSGGTEEDERVLIVLESSLRCRKSPNVTHKDPHRAIEEKYVLVVVDAGSKW